MFHSNKVSFSQIRIFLNQINFCLKSNKWYLRPYTNAIIFLFWRKIYLIQKNIYWPKAILFEWNKCYLIQINLFFEPKNAFQTNYTQKTVSLNWKFCWFKKMCFNVNKSISLDHIHFFLINKTFFNSKKYFLLPYIKKMFFDSKKLFSQCIIFHSIKSFFWV